MTDDLEGIVPIFNQAQESTSIHDMLCNRLFVYFKKVTQLNIFILKCQSFAYFADDFFELCKYSLLSAERSAYRERTIDFIVKFVLFSSHAQSEINDADKLLRKMIMFCLKYSYCENHDARFRASQILRKILVQLPADFQISEVVYEKVRVVLNQRIIDVKPNVRSQALLALSRFQDPKDPHCSVTQAIIQRMEHDSSPDVRKNALLALAITPSTLKLLVERSRDVNDSVRKTTYNILRDRSILRPLKIAQRVSLMKNGLNDHSVLVKMASKQLLVVWYNFSKRDPISLLHRFDCENESKTCEIVLQSLFSDLNRPTSKNSVKKFMTAWTEDDNKLEQLPKNMKKFSQHKEFYSMVYKWADNALDDNKILKQDIDMPVENAFFWSFLTCYLIKNQEDCLETEQVDIPNGPQIKITDDDDASEAESEQEDNNINDEFTQKLNIRIFEELLELVCPNAINLVDYLDNCFNLLHELKKNVPDEKEQLMKHLELVGALENRLSHGVKLLIGLDISDEFSRNKLEKLLKWVTTVPSLNLDDSLIQLITFLYPNSNSRIDKMVSIVNEMLDDAFEKADLEQKLVRRLEKAKRDKDKNPTNEKDSDQALESGIQNVSENVHEVSTISKARETLTQLSFVVMELKNKNPDSKEPRELTKNEIMNLRVKVAEIDVKLIELEEELREAINNRDFKSAQPLQETINEMRIERDRLQECIKSGFDKPLLVPQDETLMEESLNTNLKDLSKRISQVQVSDADPDEDVSNDSMESTAMSDINGGLNEEQLRRMMKEELEAYHRLKRIPIEIVERANLLIYKILTSFKRQYNLPPSLRLMLLTLTLPSIRFEHTSTRNYALLSVGIMGTFDFRLSMNYLCYMYAALKDCPEIADSAIACICDTFAVLGIHPFVMKSVFGLTGNPSDIEETDEIDTTIDNSISTLVSDQFDYKTCELEICTEQNIETDVLEKMNKRATSLLRPILQKMSSSIPNLRSRASICLSKLLFLNIIKSHELFSQLVIQWFSPESENLLLLRFALSKFLSEFALAGIEQQWIITDSIPLILKTLINAPSNSPLAQINMNSVISLLVRLTDNAMLERKMGEKRLYDFVKECQSAQQKINTALITATAAPDLFQQENDDENISILQPQTRLKNNLCHDELALRACNEILNSPNSGLSQQYIQLVPLLRISRKRLDNVKNLCLLANRIDKTLDRANKFIFSRFLRSLSSILAENNITEQSVLDESKLKLNNDINKSTNSVNETVVEKGKTNEKVSSQDTDDSAYDTTLMGVNLHLANSPEAAGRKSMIPSRFQNNTTLSNTTFFKVAKKENDDLDSTLLDSQLSINLNVSQSESMSLQSNYLKSKKSTRLSKSEEYSLPEIKTEPQIVEPLRTRRLSHRDYSEDSSDFTKPTKRIKHKSNSKIRSESSEKQSLLNSSSQFSNKKTLRKTFRASSEELSDSLDDDSYIDKTSQRKYNKSIPKNIVHQVSSTRRSTRQSISLMSTDSFDTTLRRSSRNRKKN